MADSVKVETLAQVGREMHRLLKEATKLTDDEAEMAYQAFRLAVQRMAGVHFDDFQRPDRPRDEDRLLTMLMVVDSGLASSAPATEA